MKRKSVLRRLGLALLVLAMFCGTLFTLTSCEVEPPTPDCEINRYGEVLVKNETGYPIYTDVTWGNISVNYEKYLYNNGSYRYTKVAAGQIEIWISFDGSDWDWNYYNLSSCEDLTYKWYLLYTKSTASNGNLCLDVIQDGVVIQTLTDFQSGPKTK